MGYTHGTKWNDELMKEKILEVKNFYNIERMPSRRECECYFSNTSLADAVSRRKGGWYKLAEDMGLPIKYSETKFGKDFEKEVDKILKKRGYKVERMSQNFPYDLLVNDCVKVDVKASRLYEGHCGDFYSYGIAKKAATCDIYILLAVNEQKEIISTYIVPSVSAIKNKQISIGKTSSKWHKFRDRWDILNNYSKFMQETNQ